MESITTALTSSFTDVASSVTGIMGDVLPIALPIVGGMIVVKLGIKIFKTVTGR